MSNHSHQENHPGGNQQAFLSKIAFLDSAMRQRTLPPEEIINHLPIKTDSQILDAGAGSGYLTIPAAKQTEATVFALDMDQQMLEVIDNKAKAENIKNIQLLARKIEELPLAEKEVDFVLASLILHEVSSLPNVLKEFNRVLKTGGYFLCLEYEKEESSIQGPPLAIRISSATMEKKFNSCWLSGREENQPERINLYHDC
ncbi:ubiquinone/menaquinone biosynthesis C-methylase UbiE [Enterococcus sp. PF1-24]|uniref:class I SAM-dependent methyltransferase n=1 Tax=unclassified Enterococcus TaxID=2608891 RepID=UPI00247548ED|nr:MULTISPECIES: class I SAM-dependent methyltransferase [unclassified Enterococcus]MDH6363046.1 ubiquinone/menaquinone biosynthesis C-methylase UbiE [Enterococcus sp. PFB1-1]MDH6400140.1 ubiquinone/menaquinone biosynthesis C-methylase UbiE [Enterococcus sp. PF1-24]